MEDVPQHYIGRYWKPLDQGRIACSLCPRFCVLDEGQRGFCFVRQNINGQMVLTTYARSSGFCIDPIEKKPLNHFYPGTSILSFGTAGCNLGCKFCQNWDISKSKEMDLVNVDAPPDLIARAAKQHGCKSVAFTYNDPVIFAEYAMDVADACHQQGIKTVAVTAGYISPEATADFFSRMDAANVDLKSFSEDFYRRMAAGKLQPVLDTLLYLKNKTNVWLEITTLLIPGENDSDREIHGLTDWLKKNLGPDVPLHFSAFHPDYRMLNHQMTPRQTLVRARNIALKKGLRYVYVGNVHDVERESTYCSHCGKLLIERDWHRLTKYHLKNKNQCKFCSTVCAGHFENEPGRWGAKRLPIRLNQHGWHR
ncbi:MAG: AmmeMemoRadiSam system radical SAM enzyme [Candidatus Omnitrophota bacterium]